MGISANTLKSNFDKWNQIDIKEKSASPLKKKFRRSDKKKIMHYFDGNDEIENHTTFLKILKLRYLKPIKFLSWFR